MRWLGSRDARREGHPSCSRRGSQRWYEDDTGTGQILDCVGDRPIPRPPGGRRAHPRRRAHRCGLRTEGRAAGQAGREPGGGGGVPARALRSLRRRRSQRSHPARRTARRSAQPRALALHPRRAAQAGKPDPAPVRQQLRRALLLPRHRRRHRRRPGLHRHRLPRAAPARVRRDLPVLHDGGPAELLDAVAALAAPPRVARRRRGAGGTQPRARLRGATARR